MKKTLREIFKNLVQYLVDTRMSVAFEINFDGMIGPSHNYSGLSLGNIASASNAGQVSRPRDAAIQGLEKMRLTLSMGLVQAVIPPLPRPCAKFLRKKGYEGQLETVLHRVSRESPELLPIAWSASSMWTANAATVSPSSDTEDDRIHLTPANLSTMKHRSIEYEDTTSVLTKIFRSDDCFVVHDALPTHARYSDEGAANHVRLCREHGSAGIEIFVYGRENRDETKSKFPARQSLLASVAIAKSHKLNLDRTLFVRQSRQAIEAGAFHNDVVCVGNLDTLFFHEYAFEDTDTVIRRIKTASQNLFELKTIMVPEAEVPLEDAVRSYMFNSQLLQVPNKDNFVLLAPKETYETPSTRVYCEKLVDRNGPIQEVRYVDLRQSMKNGGGPACLRLRVAVKENELAKINPGVLLDEHKIDVLQDIVRNTYRETLHPNDLTDPKLVTECRTALSEIYQVLNLVG